jgi:hypothetical protein
MHAWDIYDYVYMAKEENLQLYIYTLKEKEQLPWVEWLRKPILGTSV